MDTFAPRGYRQCREGIFVFGKGDFSENIYDTKTLQTDSIKMRMIR